MGHNPVLQCTKSPGFLSCKEKYTGGGKEVRGGGTSRVSQSKDACPQGKRAIMGSKGFLAITLVGANLAGRTRNLFNEVARGGDALMGHGGRVRS